jgi:PAS domain S-box-containing protein
MASRTRTPRQIKAELQQLARTGDPARDRLGLLHDVQVYQEELIVQNEELARVQTALEESRDRFVELYDFAPNGYLTLDRHGVILQINLTGAGLIGKPRQAIEGLPLVAFVAARERRRLLDFLRKSRTQSNGHDVEADFSLRPDAAVRDVQLICRPRVHPSGGRHPEYLIALIDVTERRQVEAERANAAREHAALASQLISAQDEERQRIARDLHDNIGQQVTALRLLVQVVSMADVDDGVRKRLARIQSIVEQIDQQLDFITGELRPASLDLGLVSALHQFVREWSSTFDIRAELQCAGIEHLQLEPDVETHLYRVVQEALNNVYKHAHATRVTVTLARKSSELTMTIKDEGRGFDPEAAAHDRTRGLGLLSMRERAQVIGATLDVQSAPRRGTTVRVRYRLS